jgi:hypothetical protein
MKVLKTVMLPAFLHGYDAWSVPLRKNIDWLCLTKGAKREELTANWGFA